MAAAAFLLPIVGFSTAGALIARPQPRNAIGWLFLGAALMFSSAFVIEGYASLVLLEGWDLPGGMLAAWLASWLLDAGLFAFVAWILLLFPDGRLPSPRWRPVAWYVGVA